MNSTAETEYLAYHKAKRKFMSLDDIENEKPEDIQICEFKDQNFKLVAK